MRNEIKDLSVQIDKLESNVAALRTMLSPVMHTVGVASALMASAKSEPDTRSEVSKSIAALSYRIMSLSSFIDETAKNLDLGEG